MMMAQYADTLYDLLCNTLFYGLLISVFLVFLLAAVAVSSPPISSISQGMAEVEITAADLADMEDLNDPDLMGCYSVMRALPAKFAYSKKINGKEREEGSSNGGTDDDGEVVAVGGGGGGTATSSSRISGDSVPEDDSVCVFCLNEFVEGEMLRLLPVCRHVFHADCIDQWLSSHTTCPRCRSNILLRHRQDRS